MARPSAEKRVRNVLSRTLRALAETRIRLVVFAGGVPLVIVAHALIGPQFAWLSAPLVLLAGLSSGVPLGLTIAAITAIGHAVVDLLAVGPTGAPGIVVRAVVLAGIALLGAADAQLQRQRDAAMLRSVREDPVTGLLNVRAFYDDLEQLRAEGRHFTILLADIRGMRALNDKYGHPTGTEAMRTLAHVLRRSAGQDVIASRLGSDELAIALVDADRERCRSVVSRIVERLHDETVALPDGGRFEVHAAYGIARYPEDGEDEVAVLRAADRAKEQAKSAGIDRVGTADGDML